MEKVSNRQIKKEKNHMEYDFFPFFFQFVVEVIL